jgi:ubiquinone/menaquinone biosynthesis C-methylase UbiE
MEDKYLHGFSSLEQKRLLAQGEILAKYIYPSMEIGQYSKALEIGMGVGAQTILLLKKFPNLHIKGIELSEKQIEQAKKNLAIFPELEGRYEINQGNAKHLENFDLSEIQFVFIIWILEHVPQPEELLKSLNNSLKKGTKIHLTEVFNNSLYLYPTCPAVKSYWEKLNDFQQSIGGDGDIGIRLGNLLQDAGFTKIEVFNCPMHLDNRQPMLRNEMIQYWHDLMQSFVPALLENKVIEENEWLAAKNEILGLIDLDGAVFYYHSVQARAEG